MDVGKALFEIAELAQQAEDAQTRKEIMAVHQDVIELIGTAAKGKRRGSRIAVCAVIIVIAWVPSFLLSLLLHYIAA